MKKIDKLIAEDRRVHSIMEYMDALNTFIGYNQDIAEKQEDVKLAKVLRSYIEFFSKIRDIERFEFISDVLDYYTKIVPNEEDLFKRPTIEFHVPEKIRKSLFKSFVEFDKNRKLEMQNDSDELLSTIPDKEKRIKAILMKEYEKHVDEYLRQNKGNIVLEESNDME